MEEKQQHATVNLLQTIGPGAQIIEQKLRNVSQRFRRRVYQGLTFLLTFVTYMTYHMNRRPYPIVKNVISVNCTRTVIATGQCHTWAPFTGGGDDTYIFGVLDFTFMTTYSISLFLSGYLAQQNEQRSFLVLGMLLTGTSTALFGMIRVLDVHQLGVFFVIQFVSGIAHSTGWPVVMGVMGSWVSTRHSGVFLAVWSSHKLLGGILGNLLSGALIKYDWSLAFFVPALVMFIAASAVYYFLIPHPSYVGIELRDNTAPDERTNGSSKADESIDMVDAEAHAVHHSGVGITLYQACTTNGIMEFALCMFFVKCVVYVFFFWLPFILKKLTLSTSQAAYISSLFDVGSGLGGLVTGGLYDMIDAPATICSVLLLMSVPVFLCCSVATRLPIVSLLVFLGGCFVGGPSIVITTSLAQRISSRDARSITMLAAILDGVGSLGASLGPFVVGIFEAGRDSSGNVSTLVAGCCFLGGAVLWRQCCGELKRMETLRRKKNDESDTRQ